LTSKNYVIVQGIVMQSAHTSDDPTVNIDGSVGTAILNCTIYGGTLENGTTGHGAWATVALNASSYTRIIGNKVDRQDNLVLIDNSDTNGDNYRGEGITAGGPLASNKYNIIEGNDVYNVSHYAISVPYGTSSNESDYNYCIVRNNRTYDCHVGIGEVDWNRRSLIEGNRSYFSSQILKYRDGISYEGSTQKTIIRYNDFWHDKARVSTHSQNIFAVSYVMTQENFRSDYSTHAYDRDNRYYGNNWFVGYNPDGVQLHSFEAINDSVPPDMYGHYYVKDMGRDVHVNDIFGKPGNSSSVPFFWSENHREHGNRDTLRYCLFQPWGSGYNLATYEQAPGSNSYSSVSAAHAAEPTFESSNIVGSPRWHDSTSTGPSRNFALDSLSPCINAGGHLTTVTAIVSGSQTVHVSDAGFFHYNWGRNPFDAGDSVKIGSNYSLLDSVDYDNNILFVHTAISVAAGAGVDVEATWMTQTMSYVNRLQGSAPDIGSHEYASSVTPPIGAVPDTTTQVSPTNGSTQSQPITFRWRAVTGATQYRLFVGSTTWDHSYVDVTTADTLYVASGLPFSTTFNWNMATYNANGWNETAWVNWWTFTTSAEPTYNQHITVDWNKAIVPATLTDNATIQMQNLGQVTEIVVLHNPGGYSVSWPSIKWIGRTTPPQPAAGDSSVYLFVREGTLVYGVDLSMALSGSGTSGGVSSAWVIAQLVPYLRSDKDILLGGDEEYRKVDITESTAGDHSGITIDASSNLVLYDPYQTKTLSALTSRRGSSAFSGAGRRVAVYLSGVTASSLAICTPLMANDVVANPQAGDLLGCVCKTDSLIVTRPASGTSGLTFVYDVK
jgi:hypothetical protein